MLGLIDKNFAQPVKNDFRISDNITEITTGQGDDYTIIQQVVY